MHRFLVNEFEENVTESMLTALLLELREAALGDESALMDQADAVAECFSFIQIMRTENDALTCITLITDKVEHHAIG